MLCLVFVGRTSNSWVRIRSLILLGSPRSSGGLDLFALDQQCHSFLTQGLALSTCRSYASAQTKLISFLSSAGEVAFSSSSRLPITDDLMLVIWRSLDLHLPDHCMFWPACSLGYFGFLHASEFTVPNWSSFSSSLHLGVQDIAVDSLQLHLACLSGSRALRLIHLGRAVPFTLCSLCLNDLPCAHVRCPGQPVFVANWAILSRVIFRQTGFGRLWPQLRCRETSSAILFVQGCYCCSSQ